MSLIGFNVLIERGFGMFNNENWTVCKFEYANSKFKFEISNILFIFAHINNNQNFHPWKQQISQIV